MYICSKITFWRGIILGKLNLRNVELALLFLGIAVALYLTIEHFIPGVLACSNSGLIDCQKVLTSRFSTILGIPIALMGLVWAALMFLAVYKGIQKTAIYILAGIGILAVLYSISAQYAIGNICEYCLSLDTIIILTVSIQVIRDRRRGIA